MNNCTLKFVLIGVCLLTVLVGLYLTFKREKKNIQEGARDIMNGEGNIKTGNFKFKLAIGIILILTGLTSAIFAIERLPGCVQNENQQPNMEEEKKMDKADSNKIIDDQINGDKIGGDKIGGDKIGGDKIEGDKIGGDKIGGDKIEGDKIGGDKIGGDKIGGDKVGGG